MQQQAAPYGYGGYGGFGGYGYGYGGYGITGEPFFCPFIALFLFRTIFAGGAGRPTKIRSKMIDCRSMLFRADAFVTGAAIGVGFEVAEALF